MMATRSEGIARFRRTALAVLAAILLPREGVSQSVSTSPSGSSGGSPAPAAGTASPSIPAVGNTGPGAFTSGTFWQSPTNVTSGYSTFMRDPVFQLGEMRRRWMEYHGPALSFGVFFPLTPPALGQPVDQADLRLGAGYPRELLDYVGEPFYMPYASLHKNRVLYQLQERRVEDYRSRRMTLVAELRTRLDELARLPAAERAAAHARLAADQAERLQALEAEAEAIRQSLTGASLFHATNDGEMLRAWRDLTRGEPGVVSEFMALLLAAEFQDGLSRDQRQLLREVALELRTRARIVRPDSPELELDYLGFLPATSRIRLPENLPAGTAEQVRAFQNIKAELIRELRDVIAQGDRFLFVAQRTQRYADLAASQAPRFAELERLAEQIRVVISQLPYPDAPPRSELPDELTQRVGSWVTGKTELRRAVLARLREAQRALPGYRVELVQPGGIVALAATAASGNAASPDAAERLAGLAEFNARIAERYRALARETEALRRDIQRYADAQPPNRRSVDEWAAAFNISYAAQENWQRYRDYRRAVLEPGLSPAQRRLLFQAAVIELTYSVNPPAS